MRLNKSGYRSAQFRELLLNKFDNSGLGTDLIIRDLGQITDLTTSSGEKKEQHKLCVAYKTKT